MSSQQQQSQHSPAEWGYFPNQLTPDQWPEHFAVGKQQSPINILVGAWCRHCSPATAKSACCRGVVMDRSSAQALAAKFRDQTALNRAHRRSHLDSVGEEEDRAHQRSSSTSSAGSSASGSSSGSPSRLHDEGSESGDSNESLCNRCADREDRKSRLSKCQHKLSHSRLQNTRHVVSLRKLFLGYPRFMNTMQVCNTGHNWQVSLPNELANHTRKCCQFSILSKSAAFSSKVLPVAAFFRQSPPCRPFGCSSSLLIN